MFSDDISLAFARNIYIIILDIDYTYVCDEVYINIIEAFTTNK